MGTLEVGIMTALMAMLVMAVVLFDAARRGKPRRGDGDGGVGDAESSHDRSDDAGVDGGGGGD
jgi:hypothetical protein